MMGSDDVTGAGQTMASVEQPVGGQPAQPSFREACRPQSPLEAKVRKICLVMTAGMLFMSFVVVGEYHWKTAFIVGGWTTMIAVAAYCMNVAAQLHKTGTFSIRPYPSIFFFNLVSGINIGAFNPVKGWINQFGFWADPMLAKADNLLFLGNDPWIFLTWLPGDLTTGFYVRAWFIVSLLCIPIAAYRGQYRMILLYFMIWGPLSLLPQAMFQSGGPVFFDELGYGDRFLAIPYQEQVARYSDYLWKLHSLGKTGLGTGISALPSVHVMIAVWVMLLWRDTVFKFPAIAFAGLTFLLSIALGWHYSLDGIIGGLLVWIAFKALQPLARSRQKATEAHA